MKVLHDFDNPVLSTKRAAMHYIGSSISKVDISCNDSNKWIDVITV